MNSFQLYCILKLDDIQIFMIILFFTAMLISTFTGAYYLITNEDEKFKKNMKMYIPIIFSILLLCVIIPSTKQAAILYVYPKIINNEKITEIPDKIIKLIDKYIDE